MALRMDSGVQHAPTHQRPALPQRAPPTDTKNALRPKTPPTASSSVPRKKAANTSAKGGTGAAAGERGGGAGGAGASSGGTAGESSVGQGIPGGGVKRNNGASSSASSGGGGGATTKSTPARKRVRIVDPKLGEFTVMLQPYTGDHNDICEVCDKGGPLLCCDFCNLVYHLGCIKLSETPTEELWICPACTAELTARQLNKRRRTADDGSRAASPALGERPTIYHGVKAENDAFRAIVIYKNQAVDAGLYPTAEDAARAYDRKALSLFGDAAVCNFSADEQVEVEGVGADGNTVKGVVRSFHQWRAEMQWGNKKRHLGFFERLDDASYAYNRAAVYMNGADTPLNPIKDGYIPPPPTGLPVRVPRNKMFAQQLQGQLQGKLGLPGTWDKALLARRRLQMAGKYHEPLIGEEHQVSRLPPLPPPSRPWRPPPPVAPPATGSDIAKNTLGAATVEKVAGGRCGAVVLPSAGPASPSDDHSTPGKLEDGMKCEQGAAYTARGGGGNSGGDGAAAAAAAVVSAAPSVGQCKSGSVEEDTATLSPVGPDNHSSSGVAPDACRGTTSGNYNATADIEESSSARDMRIVEGAVIASSAATTVCQVVNVEQPSASTASQNTLPDTDPETPDTKTSSEALSPNPEERLAVSSITDQQGKESEGEVIEGSSDIDAGTTVAAATQARVDTPVADVSQSSSIGIKPMLSPRSPSKQCSKVGTQNEIPLETNETPVPAVSGNGYGYGPGDLFSSKVNTTAGDGEGMLQTSAFGPSASPVPGPVHSLLQTPIATVQAASAGVESMRVSSPALPSPTFPSTSAAPVPGWVDEKPEAAGQVVDTRSAVDSDEGSSCSTSATVSLPSTMSQSLVIPASEATANRKRKLPTAAVTPNVSLVGPIPDLSLDDVAELVWDPRAGPRPRGVEPAATAAADGTKNNDAVAAAAGERLARLEKAMWDRDGTLLERVAPAHLEKAMLVLQTCRHDVDRAAQMLTVRLGIQVEGLGIRTTRHSRVEKQPSSSSARLIEPTSARSALPWRGGASSSSSFVAVGSSNDGGSGGSDASGGRVGAVTLPGGSRSSVAGGVGGAGRGAGSAGRDADAQGFSREDTKQANDAFMRYGRDLNAVQSTLGWSKKRVVEYYYCIWKFAPQYQVWKARRHHAGLPGVGTGVGRHQYPPHSGSMAAGGCVGLPNASAEGMRWRGSRLRTLKTGSSQ
ncbi:unnamed protein product [Sphacelaria rigidula]